MMKQKLNMALNQYDSELEVDFTLLLEYRLYLLSVNLFLCITQPSLCCSEKDKRNKKTVHTIKENEKGF